MSMEIEAKMAVENLAATRAKLQDLGAQRIGSFAETNTFFDTEDRSLLTADKGLRLRLNRNTETGHEDHIITYKGPRQPGPLKTREEVELTVDGATEATRLFERLGFARTLSFEKRRESWHLDKCKVELDELPYLGTFVEIEGPDEASVLRVRQRLNLADCALIKTGYVGMLTAYLQEHGQSMGDVRFEDTKWR